MKTGLDLEDIEAIEAIARKMVEILTPLVQRQAGKMDGLIILTIKKLGVALGMSTPYVKKYILADPTFPKKRVFGRGLEGWHRDDVMEWLAAQPFKSDPEPLDRI